MSYLLDCPACTHELQVPENLLGQLVRCPDCAHTFTAPTQVQDVSVAPTQAPQNVATKQLAPPPRIEPDTHGGFRCPQCHSRERPVSSQQVSVAGWIVFAVLMFTCLPLFWIGLLMKEEVKRCRDCGHKLTSLL